MAATTETVAEHVKPLEGSTVERFTAGATLVAGQPVSLGTDGYLDPADSDAFATSLVVGIVLQDAVSGDIVDVVTAGPVQCMTAATVGAVIYASPTAGGMAESAGTKSTIIGIAKTATILDVKIIWVTLS